MMRINCEWFKGIDWEKVIAWVLALLLFGGLIYVVGDIDTESAESIWRML